MLIKFKNIENRIKNAKNSREIRQLKKIQKNNSNSSTDKFIFVKLFKDIAYNDLKMLFPQQEKY
jgi:hypothetical protein